jgi:hypothetical protein
VLAGLAGKNIPLPHEVAASAEFPAEDDPDDLNP